jgi:hypothetical protein
MIDILDPWTPRCGSCWPRLLCTVRSLPAAGFSARPWVFRGMVVGKRCEALGQRAQTPASAL